MEAVLQLWFSGLSVPAEALQETLNSEENL